MVGPRRVIETCSEYVPDECCVKAFFLPQLELHTREDKNGASRAVIREGVNRCLNGGKLARCSGVLDDHGSSRRCRP